MTGEALFSEHLRRFLLDHSFSVDRAENVIARAIELATRTGIDAVRSCVEHAYAHVAPTDPRAVSLRELREVAKGSELASEFERGARSLDAATSGSPPSVVRHVVRRALRLGRFSELATALSRLGDAVGSVLPFEEFDDWGELRRGDCATLLSRLGVRHPLVFSAMAREGAISDLRHAAKAALSIPRSDWNGGREPFGRNARTMLPWAYEAVVIAAANAGEPSLGLELAESLSQPHERDRLRAEVALAAARNGDPSFAKSVVDEGLTGIDQVYAKGYVRRLEVWCTLASLNGDIEAAVRRMRHDVEASCFLASELVNAHRGRDAARVLSTLASKDPRDFHESTIVQAAGELCDEGLFAEAAALVRSTSYAPYVAHRAAWSGRIEIARAIDSGEFAPELEPLLAFREGRPVSRVPQPESAACFALLFELEQQYGRSRAVGQGTTAFPTQPFRVELSPPN